MSDARRYAAAVQRNREPILAVLARVLPPTGVVLEVASGTGEHAAFFARELLRLVWQPSDPDDECRASIAAWRAHETLPNLLPPLALDATVEPWPIARADALVNINMIHIAPFTACEGLVRGAARLLAAGAPLVLYGPFARGGHHTAPSNEAFDRGLRARNPAWGVRDLDDVTRVATAAGLTLDETVDMPANNLTVIFRRGSR
jgi:hypothetical protein